VVARPDKGFYIAREDIQLRQSFVVHSGTESYLLATTSRRSVCVAWQRWRLPWGATRARTLEPRRSLPSGSGPMLGSPRGRAPQRRRTG
jgi:hypothetical protein